MRAADVYSGLEVYFCANPSDGGTLTGKTKTWHGDDREWGWIEWTTGLRTWVDLALVHPKEPQSR